MKSKMLMPVLAVMLVFGLANTAFAQLSCSVASTPVSRDTSTGHTEVAGDLIFNCVAGVNATTSATVTVDYGVVISNSTTHPAGQGISIANTAGGFLGGNAPVISAVNNASGQVVLSIPAQAVPADGSFTLTGILVSLADSGKTSLMANVSVSPGNNVLIVAGQNNATVITTILPGIKAPTLTTTAPPSSGLVLSTGIVPFPGFSIDIAENYIDSYRSAAQFNGGFSTNSTRVQLTFNGIPAGVTLTGCSVTAASGSPTVVSGGPTTITSAANVLSIEFGTATNLTAIDTLTFACTGVTVGSTATIPLTAGNITVQATLAPTGTALSSTGTVLTSTTAGQIPRYKSDPLPTPALTVIAIVPAQTNFLVPFAVVNAQGYDTGIAIANTTTDPFGLANGGARAQSGNVTFTFYPQTGSACTVTPSGTTVGTGFSAGGNIDSGRTVTVLASELLRSAPASAGCPTAFTGYIFAVANFTHGHGSAFVSDFRSFTSYTNMLIVPPPSLPGNSRALATFEVLGH